MSEEVVHCITSGSGRFRGEVVRHPSGGFRVQVIRWSEEWVEGYGKIAEFWERVSAGSTFADTPERAEVLAREELALWDDVPTEVPPA